MRKKIILLVFSMFALAINAQRYEAENATLTGAASVNGNTVSLADGSISFSISNDTESFYNIYINTSSASYKQNNFIINGSGATFVVDNANYTDIQVASFAKLPAGTNILEITPSWGWINIDFIELVKVDASDRFNLTQELVNPNATDEAKRMFAFMLDNYGDKILSGAMTLNSFDESNWLKEQTGKEPVVLGIDFLQTDRGYTWYNDNTPANDAKTWYNKNGIPHLMWHWRDPSRTTEAFYTADTDFDISPILTEGSIGYNQMLDDIDFVSNQLKDLQDDGIPVLWRPLHEAAGGWFWWGAKGAEPCKELWQIMYDRMVNYHGLNNLIWIWTSEPGDDDWYPGDDYVDIIGRDIYKEGDHSSHVLEFNNLNSAYDGTKMVTLSEVGSFPDVDNLIADDAAWSFYMPWYGEYTRSATYNDLALWQKMFAHDYVLTLDEMPNLRTYQTVTGLQTTDERPKILVFPTQTEDIVSIQSMDIIQTIQLFDLMGNQVLNIDNLKNKNWNLSLGHLQKGNYVLAINNSDRRKLIIK